MATITLTGTAYNKVTRRYVRSMATAPLYTGSALSRMKAYNTPRYTRPISIPRPTFFYGTPVEYLSDVSLGYFTGVVTENTNPVAYAAVVVFDRATCKPLARVMTNSSGVFTTPSIFDKTAADFFAVAFDPAGGVSYNAIIYDKLQAV